MIIQYAQKHAQTYRTHIEGLSAKQMEVYAEISAIPADYTGYVKFGTNLNPVWAYVTPDSFYLYLANEWMRVATQRVAARTIAC